MPESDHDALLTRLASGAAGIHADPSVPARVSAVVSRRRRRRAAATALASAVVVAVAAVGVAIVAPRLTSGEAQPADPGRTEGTDRPSAVTGDTYRPAGFFADVVGGRAVPTITRFRVAPGEKFLSRFDWYPPGSTSTPFLGAVALERFAGSPGQACAALLGGVPTCAESRGGAVLASYEVPAERAVFDPVHEAAPIEFPAPGQTVRGLVLLRTDGLAVSVLVCDCTADGGEVIADAPPLSFEELEPVVTDPSWTGQP